MNELEIWEKYGKIQKTKEFKLGPHTSFQYKNSPRHILFTLSRYKFAQKLIGKNKRIIEFGVGDGIGIPILSEFSEVVGVDFDEDLIKFCMDNLSNDKVEFIQENFLGKTYGKYDAVVCMDVIEHTKKENEDLLLQTICKNLSEHGIAIIGTPNLTAKCYSKDMITDAHVNLYDYERLQILMEYYFHFVYIFSQNDEMIHTGYLPMAHYLIAIGIGKK